MGMDSVSRAIGVFRGAAVSALVVAAVLVSLTAASDQAAAQARPNPYGPPRHGGDPAYLTLGGGIFDITDDETAGMFRFEYRSDVELWIVKPLFGMEINLDGGFYGYFGLQTDLYFGNRWVLTPTAAVGGYAQGRGKDLGHGLEFRTGGEFAYRFDNRSRLGIAVHHISNANIGAKNPGIENITINYSVPLHEIISLIP